MSTKPLRYYVELYGDAETTTPARVLGPAKSLYAVKRALKVIVEAFRPARVEIVRK